MDKGLIKLQENIQGLLNAGYTDDIVSYIISHSNDIRDLNSRIEDELSYAK